jgi:hypothetical protein
MTGPAVRAVPFADLAGSVRQSLSELAKISEAMDSGHPPGEATAMRLSALAAELREAAAAITSGRRPDEDSTTMIRGFLAAVVEALAIPQPAGPDDERAYLRSRSLRADECVRACQNIMDSANDPVGRNWAWSAGWLRVVPNSTVPMMAMPTAVPTRCAVLRMPAAVPASCRGTVASTKS